MQFLLASQSNFTCTELSQVSPVKNMAHDAPTRMLDREKLTPKILWKNAQAHVDLKQGCLVILEELNIPKQGLQVHLRGYGFIKVFKKASKQRGIEYYASSNLDLTASDVKRIYSKHWQISVHAFLLLELHRLKTNITWQQAKLSIARDAIQQYLLNPRLAMQMATA